MSKPGATSLRMAIYLLLEQNVGALVPKQRDLLETARDDADRLLRSRDGTCKMHRFHPGNSGVFALERGAEAKTLVELDHRSTRDARDVLFDRLEDLGFLHVSQPLGVRLEVDGNVEAPIG